MSPYRVTRLREQRELNETLYGAYGNLKELMLYVHVPFCDTRCQFCEYTVVNPTQGRQHEVRDAYFDAMIDEMKMYDSLLSTHKKRLVGFDIGGGTPSMADILQIERVMKAAVQYFNLNINDMEVSIETTPKIAASEPDKIRAYRQMGIRRISMGVQTTDFNQARRLARDDANILEGSGPKDILSQAVHNIRTAGFESFNCDLMYGFPIRNGTKDPWQQTVLDCIGLAPEHITLYRMRYKGTAMAHLQSRVFLEQVNQQEHEARTLLFENGYGGMLGKNTYSKVNSGCSDYLDKRVVQGVPYLGMGLGAQSFSHHTLQYNLGAVTKKMEQYIRSVELKRLPIQDLYHLSRRAAMGKFCSVSFYYGGIDLHAFHSIFGTDLREEFRNEVTFLLHHGLMYFTNGRLQVSDLGKKYFGGVISMFYSPSVKNHIVHLEGGEVSEVK
jgi:oxygen-independent coproporphyrinogen-3 oxidase